MIRELACALWPYFFCGFAIGAGAFKNIDNGLTGLVLCFALSIACGIAACALLWAFAYIVVLVKDKRERIIAEKRAQEHYKAALEAHKNPKTWKAFCERHML